MSCFASNPPEWPVYAPDFGAARFEADDTEVPVTFVGSRGSDAYAVFMAEAAPAEAAPAELTAVSKSERGFTIKRSVAPGATTGILWAIVSTFGGAVAPSTEAALAELLAAGAGYFVVSAQPGTSFPVVSLDKRLVAPRSARGLSELSPGDPSGWVGGYDFTTSSSQVLPPLAPLAAALQTIYDQEHTDVKIKSGFATFTEAGDVPGGTTVEVTFAGAMPDASYGVLIGERTPVTWEGGWVDSIYRTAEHTASGFTIVRNAEPTEGMVPFTVFWLALHPTGEYDVVAT